MLDEPEHIYSVTFSTTRSLCGGEPEPDDYVISIRGHLYDNGQEIGRMAAYVIEVDRAVNEGQSLSDVCDAHSQTVEEYWEALFDANTQEIKESIQEQLGYFSKGNILILDRIEVLPAHRKQGLGLAVACSFLDTFEHSDGLAVGLPHPLQFSEGSGDRDWNEKMEFENLTKDKHYGTKKLENYWAKVGMQPLKGIYIHNSPVYGLSFEKKRPRLSQLVPNL